MKINISLFLLLIFITSCEYNLEKSFSVNLKKEYKIGEMLQIELVNKKDIALDSVSYFLDNIRIGETYTFDNDVLGKKVLNVHLYANEKKATFKKLITLYAKEAPKLYTYKIINEYPHDTKAYTQGLEFYQDTLYESTGLRGFSSLRKVDFRTGKPYKKIALADEHFGEGITLLNDKIYQLTWQEDLGIIYNKNTFKTLGSFPYDKSKEGWGLCNDGKNFYKSDGSENIWILDTLQQKELRKIQVMTNKSSIKKVNELEWANGKIYANTYQYNKEVALIINPTNGKVEGVIDFSGLKQKVKQIPKLDVLNGIAYHPKRKTFFVTGKNWSKIFEVEIFEKK